MSLNRDDSLGLAISQNEKARAAQKRAMALSNNDYVHRSAQSVSYACVSSDKALKRDDHAEIAVERNDRVEKQQDNHRSK